MATTNLSDYQPLNIKNAGEFNIGIVVSEWNNHITGKLLEGAKQTLIKEGVAPEKIQIFQVPGAFELIYASKKLCDTKKYHAIISIGCVIRGETPHFDYVCSAVAQGIKDCNVLTDTSAIFCLLTDDTEQQSLDRSGGKHGNKGVEAAVTALKMIDFNQKI